MYNYAKNNNHLPKYGNLNIQILLRVYKRDLSKKIKLYKNVHYKTMNYDKKRKKQNYYLTNLFSD